VTPAHEYEWIIDALSATWGAIDGSLSDRDEADYDRPSACPGWSVRDVLSHLIGFELALAGQSAPPLASEMPDFVRNPIGEMNEPYVAARRATPGPKVLDEFDAVAAASLARLRALDDDGWDVVGWSPEGEAPYHRFMETRILDSWIHLQDIRAALGLDEAGPEAGRTVVLGRFAAAMPYVVGRRVRPPDGATVRVRAEGPGARVIDIEMRDGRARAVDRLLAAPTAEIVVSSSTFWRRAAGRIDAATAMADPETRLVGDDQLARRVIEEMAVMI
jgi:uncharacterized protein (TIGR03083 family)